MLGVRQDLYSLLTASTELTAIVDDRIYPNFAPPKDADFPYLTYTMTNGVRPKTHDQDIRVESKADRYEIVVSVWALSPDEAIEIAELVDQALDGRNGDNTAVFLYDDASETPVLKDDNSGEVITQIAVSFIAIRKPA